MSTTLLPPPVGPPQGRRSGGGWVGGFLTAAHVVSECLLMGRELESELGVRSEPPTELIPSLFGVVMRAILVVWTICHLRSERVPLRQESLRTEPGTLVKLNRVDSRFHPVRNMAILSPEVSH